MVVNMPAEGCPVASLDDGPIAKVRDLTVAAPPPLGAKGDAFAKLSGVVHAQITHIASSMLLRDAVTLKPFITHLGKEAAVSDIPACDVVGWVVGLLCLVSGSFR